MPSISRSGPDDGSAWQPLNMKDGSGRPFPLLTLSTADSRQQTRRIAYYVAARPRLVRDAQDAPVFSLSLYLSRAPLPQEPNIAPLIEQGLLNCRIGVSAPPEIRDALANDDSVEYRPLFAQSALFS